MTPIDNDETSTEVSAERRIMDTNALPVMDEFDDLCSEVCGLPTVEGTHVLITRAASDKAIAKIRELQRLLSSSSSSNGVSNDRLISCLEMLDAAVRAFERVKDAGMAAIYRDTAQAVRHYQRLRSSSPVEAGITGSFGVTVALNTKVGLVSVSDEHGNCFGTAPINIMRMLYRGCMDAEYPHATSTERAEREEKREPQPALKDTRPVAKSCEMHNVHCNYPDCACPRSTP